MQSQVTAKSPLLLGKKMPLNFVAAGWAAGQGCTEGGAFSTGVASSCERAGWPLADVRGDDEQTFPNIA